MYDIVRFSLYANYFFVTKVNLAQVFNHILNTHNYISIKQVVAH